MADLTKNSSTIVGSDGKDS